MAFSSFDIRKIAGNSQVDIYELDKLVREEFSLKDHEIDKPYGHFYFTESEEELDGFQKSISWAGLIHVIIYYSNINYGKSSIYDIEAAIAWVREHAIQLPNSALAFTTKLMRFLKQRGYYVFVNFHRDEYRNSNEYVNTYNSYKILKNESGLFECDENGKLLEFYPDSRNLIDEAKIRETYTFGKSYYKPCVHSLVIPEGVTALEREFFSGGFVKDQIQFPQTLVSLGDKWNPGVFSNSCLPEIIISDNVCSIGEFAFGNSHIKSLRFTRVPRCEYLRQLKGAYIGTLFLPKECLQLWQRCFDGSAFLHETNDVVFLTTIMNREETSCYLLRS